MALLLWPSLPLMAMSGPEAPGPRDLMALVVPPTLKVGPLDAGFPSPNAVFDGGTIRLSASRGEHEAFQVVLGVSADTTATVSLSPLTGPQGALPRTSVRFYKEHYVDIDGALWPDPLAPVPASGQLDLATGQNNPVLVDVLVPRDALAGDYGANLTVESPEGTATLPLSLSVQNLTIPQNSTLETWFDDASSEWASYYGYAAWSAQHQSLMRNVYRQYKDLRISPGNIALGQVGRYNMTVNGGAVSVDFSATDPWLEYCLDELGLPRFRFPLTGYSPRRADMAPSTGHPDGMYYWGAPPYDMNPTYADHVGQYIKLVADHYRQKGWLDKACTYVTDEPLGFNDGVDSYWQHPDYNVVRQFYDLTKSKASDLKFINSVQLVPELCDHTDIWAVPGGSYHELDAQKRMEANQTVWWYNVDAGIASEGTAGRALYWDTFSRGVQGVLYWGTNYWDYGTVNGDPWQGSYSNGDGYLFYPGNSVGIMDDVVPSLRLFLARDGIEDYELLHMYGERYGVEEARAVAYSVAVGSSFAGERFRPIDDGLIYEVREWLMGQLTRPRPSRTWTDTFHDATNISSASDLASDLAWEGSYSLAPANASVALDALDSLGGWHSNDQPSLNSTLAIDTGVRSEGTGSLRIEWWRNDDPAVLGGYGPYPTGMCNGRVVTNAISERDWSGYDTLEMDVRSEQMPPGGMTMLIGDAQGTVVSDRLHAYTRYSGAAQNGWVHAVINISGSPRSDVRFIEPIIYNNMLEDPWQHYAYWLDNITLRKAGYRSQGQLQSAPVDLGAQVAGFDSLNYVSQWDLPDGASLAFETRTSIDNQSWGPWQPAPPSGHLSVRPASPPARYFQYRVLFASSGTGTPVLSGVRLEYQPLLYTDLALGNLTFDPPVPNENETFNISVPVYNLGGADIIGAYVLFTMQSGPNPLPFANITFNISAGANTTLRFECAGQDTNVNPIPISATLKLPLGLTDNNITNNSAFAWLTINGYPRPAIRAPGWAFVNEEVAFNASGSFDVEGIASFHWEFPDQNFTGEEARRAFDSTGTWAYTLTAEDLYHARATAFANISIYNHTPVPDFVVNPESGSVLTRFSFVSTAYDPDGQITNHSWDFGDGDRAWGRVAGHQYAKYGDFQVDYTIFYQENGTFRNSSVLRTVHVLNMAPTANFTISPNPAGKRKVVVFDASSSTDPDDILGDEAFNWSFGDGATGTGMLAHHSYTSAGLFTVTLTVTDGLGACDNRSAQLRVVNALPLPDFTAPEAVACNESFTLDASASRDPDGSIVDYLWEFDDGTTAAGKATSHSFVAPGGHRVRLSITDDDGGTASTERLINATAAATPKPPRPPVTSEPWGTGLGIIAAVGVMLALIAALFVLRSVRRRGAPAAGGGEPPEALPLPSEEAPRSGTAPAPALESAPPPAEEPLGTLAEMPSESAMQQPALADSTIGHVDLEGAPPSGEGGGPGTAQPAVTVVPLPLEAESEGMPPAPEDAFLPYVRPPPAPSGRRPAGRPSVPPPRVVRSLDAAPPHPPTATLAAAPIQARPVPAPPPATSQKEEVRTIDLETAAGKVIELPRARPAQALGKTEAPPRPARQETPKEQAAAGAPAGPAAEPEVDPTLPFNPWGTRKK